ncbi:nucleoside hydrolase [Allomeiothermus silvanus]|uniref:nucleoside hydrolase n=1 Tax=Allomeiothermus silvanus TaxID=52022 RepID=UPI000A003314
MPLHDPVTVAYLVAPELFEFQPAHIEVELCGRFSRGATVCDFREQPNALVATRADGEAIIDMVISAFSKLNESGNT